MKISGMQAMNDRQRLLFLILILTIVALFTTGVTNYFLYNAAFEQNRERLVVTVTSQARLIEAFAKHEVEIDLEGKAGLSDTVAVVKEFHEKFEGFGEAGEFTLARREGDQIIFLFRQGHHELGTPKPIPFDSQLAEPMRQALLGRSGTLAGLDYHGDKVLAAFEPVAMLNLGIVAKIDLSEIRAPFVETGIITGVLALLAILAGAFLFVRTTNPMLRRIQESEEKFRGLFEQANDSIFIIDAKTGKFLDANENASKRLGYTREELLRLSFEDLHSPHEFLRVGKAFRELKEKGRLLFEITHLRKDGSEIQVEISSRLIKYGDQQVIQSVVREITERKQAEAELSRHREHLEELVEERTRELREAQEQLVLREKLAVLGQLAGGVGHELRNPLGAIKNAAYFLNMALEKPEPEVKETLEILNEEVTTCERIIESLLDFARPTPPTRQKVDINDIVQRALDRASLPGTIETVTRLHEALPAILTDPGQVSQIFANIILNAIQAMPDGGRLEVKSEVPAGGWVTVSFSDTGAGIPEENLAKLFEPLFTTKAKGIGLGLALSQTLVEGQGGTIEVKSEVGKGSTFTVRLPAGREEQKAHG